MKKNCFWGMLLGIIFVTLPLSAQEFLLETIPAPEMPAFQINYTWADFLQGKSCLKDVNALQQFPFLSSEQQTLKDKMQTYCVGKVSIWDKLLTLFWQNKKALLIDRALKENDSFIGHLKTIPYYLFDFHNTQPQGTHLSATLDRIQNALQNKDPSQVVLLMQDLPTNDQLFFISLFNEANELIDFKKALKETEELRR